MKAKLITLEEWAKARYSDEASPNRDTLRRWARDGKIFPAPQKQGCKYVVPENAEYVDDFNDTDFMRRVRDTATA